MRALAAFAALLSCLAPVALAQDRVRIAVFDAELRRAGPGLLLRDISGGKDPQVAAVVEVIADLRPDILALLSFDWDYDGQALSAFERMLARAGAPYPYRFSARPNTGLATGLDLDGDGRRGGPGDSQGYADFSGQSGLAVLSTYPIDTDAVQDFTDLLWRDVPDALMPVDADGAPFPSSQAWEVQRLSSTNHWAVPIALPDGQSMTLLTFHASPPVFDGAEDRNGRRNHDEIVFWQHYLDGAFGPAPDSRFVLAGGANLDPVDSDGRRAAIRSLLANPRLQDPSQTSPAAGQDTVDWRDVGAGILRVDYVLPSADWTVLDGGVVWPLSGTDLEDAVTKASRHRMVWVDLSLR